MAPSEEPEADAPTPRDPGDGEQSPRIEFFVQPQHAYLLEVAPPVPAGSVLPGWWRDTEPHYQRQTPFQVYPSELRLRQNATVRTCPGIRDYLTGGYILPLWSDVAITFDGDTYRWEAARSDFAIESHEPAQYEKMPSSGFPVAIKFISPWFCRTPPGYSIRMLPCFYFFEQLWQALPGVIHSDTLHATNVNLFFEITKGQIVLPEGTPLAHVIPYRRERYALDVREATDEDVRDVARMQRSVSRFFHVPHIYPGAKGTT